MPHSDTRTSGNVLRRLLLTALLLGTLLTIVVPPGAIGAADSGSLDRPGVVTLADGRTLEGEIVETETDVIVTVSGIATTISRSQIQSIEYGTREERLRRRLADARTADERMDIGDAALAAGLLDLAVEVAQSVQDQYPLNQRASALLDHVELQRKVERASGQGVRRSSETPISGPIRPSRSNKLNDEQIALIRRAELQERDAAAGRDRPRISFRDGVIKRFADSQMELDFREFNRADDVTKALRILRDAPEPEMIEDVHIASHPTGVLEYLRRVEPILLNGCATSACHGGAAAASFALHPYARDEEISYTNFYILNTRTIPVPGAQRGIFDAESDEPLVRRLVDRTQPDQSLLLSYMLPREKTRNPHPLVKNYNGVVLTTEAPQYQIVRRWISEVLGPAPPRGYGFDFELDLPATQPSTLPVENRDARPSDSARPRQQD